MIVPREGRFGQEVNHNVAMMMMPFSSKCGSGFGQMSFDLCDAAHFATDVGPETSHGVPVTKPDMVRMMDTADHCLAVRDNVGFVAGHELADSHNNSNMFRSNRRLRETLREGVLESPEYGFNLNSSTASDREDPDIGKQTGAVRVNGLSRVPGKLIRANGFTINETLWLPERPAWDRGSLPR